MERLLVVGFLAVSAAFACPSGLLTKGDTTALCFIAPYADLPVPGTANVPVRYSVAIWVRTTDADVSAFSITIRYEQGGKVIESNRITNAYAGLAGTEFPVPSKDVKVLSISVVKLRATEVLDF